MPTNAALPNSSSAARQVRSPSAIVTGTYNMMVGPNRGWAKG